MRQKKLRLSNKAFSLCEVVVATVVVSVVAIGLGSIIISNSNDSSGNTSIDSLQNSTDDAALFIESTLKSSNAAVCFWVKGDSGFEQSLTTTDMNKDQVIAVYTLDRQNAELISNYVCFKAKEKTIYTFTVKNTILPYDGALPETVDLDTSVADIVNLDVWNVLSPNVEGLSFDLSSFSTDKTAKLTIEAKDAEISYTSDIQVSIENEIVVNQTKVSLQ